MKELNKPVAESCYRLADIRRKRDKLMFLL